MTPLLEGVNLHSSHSRNESSSLCMLMLKGPVIAPPHAFVCFWRFAFVCFEGVAIVGERFAKWGALRNPTAPWDARWGVLRDPTAPWDCRWGVLQDPTAPWHAQYSVLQDLTAPWDVQFGVLRDAHWSVLRDPIAQPP